MEAGATIRDERRRRRWTLRELAARCGLTAAAVHRLESGLPGSIETYARVAAGLGLRPELRLADERRVAPERAADPLHALMGEVEARTLAEHGYGLSLDEPFQYYQFAGRADLVAWDIRRSALLHVENKTRLPNLQEAFGSYNAKRRYLAPIMADRLGLTRGFRTVTHAIVALWSSEVQHVVRIRSTSLRAILPDGPDAFAAWWSGGELPAGSQSVFILLDPLDRPRSRRWVGVDGALRAGARYRGYAEAMEVARAAGVA